MSFNENVMQAVQANLPLLEAEGIKQLVSDRDIAQERVRVAKFDCDEKDKRNKELRKYNDELETALAKANDRLYDVQEQLTTAEGKNAEADKVLVENQVMRRTINLHEDRQATSLALLDNAIKTGLTKKCPKETL